MKLKTYELEIIADNIIDLTRSKIDTDKEIKENIINELVENFQIDIIDDDEM